MTTKLNWDDATQLQFEDGRPIESARFMGGKPPRYLVTYKDEDNSDGAENSLCYWTNGRCVRASLPSIINRPKTYVRWLVVYLDEHGSLVPHPALQTKEHNPLLFELMGRDLKVFCNTRVELVEDAGL
jgi:hypothetical protein